MLATNDVMSGSVRAGQPDSEILKKRFRKLDATLKPLPSDLIDFIHKVLAKDNWINPYVFTNFVEFL